VNIYDASKSQVKWLNLRYFIKVTPPRTFKVRVRPSEKAKKKERGVQIKKICRRVSFPPRIQDIVLLWWLVVVAACVFKVYWLPPDSGDKISLSITVLLAFSVLLFVVTESIPASSEHTPVLGGKQMLIRQQCVYKFKKQQVYLVFTFNCKRYL